MAVGGGVERGFGRHGIAAGVSTVRGIGAGVLANVATSGWTWPVGIGLAVLAGGWVGFEVWRAARDGDRGVASDGHGAHRWDRRGVRRRSLAPPKGLLPARVHGREELL